MMEQTSSEVMRTASGKPQVAAGCLYLFAQPFCGFGLFASVWSIWYMLAGNLPMTVAAAEYGCNRSFDFADGIRDKREADWLADQISQRLGLKQ
jgi:hypothetical protein